MGFGGQIFTGWEAEAWLGGRRARTPPRPQGEANHGETFFSFLTLTTDPDGLFCSASPPLGQAEGRCGCASPTCPDSWWSGQDRPTRPAPVPNTCDRWPPSGWGNLEVAGRSATCSQVDVRKVLAGPLPTWLVTQEAGVSLVGSAALCRHLATEVPQACPCCLSLLQPPHWAPQQPRFWTFCPPPIFPLFRSRKGCLY